MLGPRTILVLVLLFFLTASCSHRPQVYQPPPDVLTFQTVRPVYPEARFAVMTDLHLHTRDLGIAGPAFQDYLDKDRKLLAESEEILDVAIDRIAALPVTFVLVCGDLSKDGEKVNLLAVQKKLHRLTAAGKQVFVVPGNHDVANYEAVSYLEDRSEPVANVTADEFAQIFSAYGYGGAIERDGGSLSYLAEPVPGLWLLALDSCKWKENEPGGHSRTGGAYSEETFQWIERMLVRSKRENKAVIVFQHHGIMEHYPHNDRFYPKYLVDDHPRAADMLSASGVELVFTGHFHAQDITEKRYDTPPRVIYDIETGSTVTAPCPFRVVRLTADQQAIIESRFVGAIASHESNFPAFAREYVYNGTLRLADDALKGYLVGKADRDILNPQVSRAYVTHLAGDEKKPAPVVDRRGLGLWGRLVMFLQQDLIDGWYTDLPPADNELVIRLGGKETAAP